MPKKTPSGASVDAADAGATARLVCAAGAVLWRQRCDEVEVAIIHRPRYDDWSLPKGKVDPGETEPLTAMREVLEETGHHAQLGRRLGVVTYPIQQGVKRVRFWSARSLGGAFVAGPEVDEMVWLSIPDAMNKLGYTYDRKILRRFAKYPVDTQTVLVVRHGTAGRRSRFSGADTLRPLDRKGRAQAESLTEQLLAFGATDVYAADRLRCHQTVEPLAAKLGVTICNEPTLTEEAYSDSPKKAHRRVLEIAGLRDDAGLADVGAPAPGQGRVPVICSQGKVIPGLIAWWCERDGVRPDKSRNRKGGTWVLSLSGGRLVAADHLDSPLAAKASIQQDC